MSDFYHYNKDLKNYSRSLRNNSTKAEIKLWTELLRARKMMGYSFLRQRPIGNYIADFLCKELRLIIEVDGITHDNKELEDQLRDSQLKHLGFTTLRFSDDDIMNDLNYVEDTIKIWIKENRKK